MCIRQQLVCLVDHDCSVAELNIFYHHNSTQGTRTSGVVLCERWWRGDGGRTSPGGVDARGHDKHVLLDDVHAVGRHEAAN